MCALPDQARPIASRPAFPLGKVLGWLTLVGGLGLAGLSGTAAAAWEQAVAWQAVLLVGGVSYLATLVSLAPVAALARWGVMPTVYGYFGGAIARVILCVGVVLLAVGLLEMPVAAVLVGLSLYLPLLFVEAGWVGRFLWSLDAANVSREMSA